MKSQIHIIDSHFSILGNPKALTSITEEKRYMLRDRILDEDTLKRCYMLF